MDQNTRFSLERYFNGRLSVQKASAEDRALTSIRLDSESGAVTVPPALSSSDYTVSWDFPDSPDGEPMGGRELAHLIFCSRIAAAQEEGSARRDNEHYLRQVLERIADESGRGILLVDQSGSPLYENPTARKWQVSERFFNYCAESGDHNIDASESYTITLGGTSPLKLRLFNCYSAEQFMGRLILAHPFTGESASAVETSVRKTSGFQKIIGDSPS